MATKEDKTALLLRVSDSLLKGIDDFRFRNRFPSRAGAIAWLLRAALDAKLKPEKPGAAGE